MHTAFNPRTLMSAAVIIAATAALASATGAFFTDSETSVANVFQAGTLNLSLNDWNGATTIAHAPFSVSNMMPGDFGEKIIVLETNTDAWGKITLFPATTTNPGAEGSGNLWDELMFTVAYAESESGPYTTLLSDATLPTTGYTLYSEDMGNEYLHAGEPVYVKVMYSLPTTTGNAAQGDSVSFDVTVDAMQYKNNAEGYKP